MKARSIDRQFFTALCIVPLAVLGLGGCDNEAATGTTTQSPVPEKRADGDADSDKLSDAEIEAAIVRELFYDPSISTHDIDVSVTEGIASLTGRVEHLLAKERAQYVTSMVKGVRAISNRLAVNVPTLPDDVIENAVAGSLILDPTTERFGIDIDVHDQVVTLTGTVQSHAEKDWAGRAAKYVVGVKDVKNDVKVDYRVNRTDEQILQDVQGNLRWDSVVNDGLVQVHVDNGYVTLSGIVGSLAEIERAQTDAWVAGVKGVDSRNVEVKWWAKNDDLRQGKFVEKTDQDMQKALDAALLFDPRVNSYGIEASVSRGVAKLRGKAPTLSSRRAAEDVAGNVVGVVRVVNDIEVDYGSELDPALQARLQEGLEQNVITAGANISVEVDTGIATLTGTVQNFTQKSHAEMLARSLRGIRGVENRLEVRTPKAFALDLGGSFDSPYRYPAVTSWASRVSSIPLKTDREIKADIQREIAFSPYVTDDAIDVAVANGVATLTGRVTTLRERRAAVANAYQGGAVEVRDEMTY